MVIDIIMGFHYNLNKNIRLGKGGQDGNSISYKEG